MSSLCETEGFEGDFCVNLSNVVDLSGGDFVDDDFCRGEEVLVDLVEVVTCFLEDVVEWSSVAFGCAAWDLLEVVDDLRCIHGEVDLTVVDGCIVSDTHCELWTAYRRDRCSSCCCDNLSGVESKLVELVDCSLNTASCNLDRTNDGRSRCNKCADVCDVNLTLLCD